MFRTGRERPRLRLGLALAAIAVVLSCAGPAAAQSADMIERTMYAASSDEHRHRGIRIRRPARGIRPSDDEPSLPPLGEPDTAPPLELPPIGENERPPSAGLRLFVRDIEVLGSSVFSQAELRAVTQPYAGRWLDTRSLVAMTQVLTDLYHGEGYTTSRAFLPDQDADDGVVRVRIVEGRLSEIVVEGNERLRDVYLRSRIERAAGVPLDVTRLAEQLEILQQSRQIERLEAVLSRGAGPGEHVLHVRVEERLPWTIAGIADNHRSPSIGSNGGGFEAAHWNPVGLGEEFSVRGRFSEGLLDLGARFTIPLTSADTELVLDYRHSEADVVEEPFEVLDIDGRLRSAFVELRQPLYRSRSLRLVAGLRGEWRESRSRLLGRKVCFQAGVLDCETSVAVIRLSQDLQWRRRRLALAARSTFSFGIDALAASIFPGRGPDGRFFAWLGQLQLASLLPLPAWAEPALLGTQLVGRGDLQLAADPLLSIEQISIGGARTVRGYRENLLVRDNAAIGSVELRAPLLRDRFDRSLIEVAPFFDIGRAWNVRGGLSTETISSVGVGVRVFPLPGLRGELYWGHNLQDEIVEGDSLQRHGLHFQVVWNVF